MFSHTISRFDQSLVTIHPGEYFVSAEDIIISTVLGSCISVSMFDKARCFGGINHFMLPGDLEDKDVEKSRNAKYGMFAIELLYNDMLKGGSRKADIVAKVFGGGSVLRIGTGPTKIPKGNIDFAFAYLEKENIPVVASDTGGNLPRKIFFFVRTGKVLLKRISGSVIEQVKIEEEAYLRKIRDYKEGPIIMFKK